MTATCGPWDVARQFLGWSSFNYHGSLQWSAQRVQGTGPALSTGALRSLGPLPPALLETPNKNIVTLTHVGRVLWKRTVAKRPESGGRRQWPSPRPQATRGLYILQHELEDVHSGSVRSVRKEHGLVQKNNTQSQRDASVHVSRERRHEVEDHVNDDLPVKGNSQNTTYKMPILETKLPMAIFKILSSGKTDNS